MCCPDAPSGLSLLFAQLTAESLSRNCPLLKEAASPSVMPPVWWQPASMGMFKGLASCLDLVQLQKDHPAQAEASVTTTSQTDFSLCPSLPPSPHTDVVPEGTSKRCSLCSLWLHALPGCATSPLPWLCNATLMAWIWLIPPHLSS